MTYAFRCKTCGHLEPAEHAGENEVPHACSVCGGGVTLGPRTKDLSEELCRPDLPVERRQQIARELLAIAKTGENQKHVDPDNWEVLAGCDDAHLEKYGLARADVTEHKEYEAEGKKYPVKSVAKGPVRGRTLSMTLGATEHTGASS